MTDPRPPRETPPPGTETPTVIKIMSAIGGFLAFYMLGGALLSILPALDKYGSAVLTVAGIVAIVLVVALGGRMLRATRGNSNPAMGCFALGFVSAMVVFGGCIVLLSGL